MAAAALARSVSPSSKSFLTTELACTRRWPAWSWSRASQPREVTISSGLPDLASTTAATTMLTKI